jgi:hypothetical protein
MKCWPQRPTPLNAYFSLVLAVERIQFINHAVQMDNLESTRCMYIVQCTMYSEVLVGSLRVFKTQTFHALTGKLATWIKLLKMTTSGISGRPRMERKEA